MARVFSRCMIAIAVSLCAPVFAAGQSSPAEPAATLRANANLVVVDVVVTDAQHNPVHKLTTGDFTLLENGHPQTIKTFEEHTAGEAAAPLPALPKLPPGLFTNFSSAPASGALNILLLDTLNTPLKDQPVVRDQVLKYLKEARPGTRMAVFGLNMRLELLQGFTSDPELLRSLLNGKKNLPKNSPILADAVGTDSPGSDDAIMNDATDALGNSPDAAMILANLQQFQAEQQAVMLQLRVGYTLDALNELGRYLSRIPGRKNLIWFSGSFPLSILPDGDLQSPFSIVTSFEDEFRETTALLTLSQVAVYPIDARGLMSLPMLNAANSGAKYARNPTSFAKDSATFSQQTAAEHATMQQMAEATGGEAFVNTNGLKEAVQKAVDDGSNYYTLTYTPTNQQWKGDYRKIQIAMARQGLTLAYRRGYFADDPNIPPRHGDPTPSGTDRTAHNAMNTAMLRGGPDPVQIIFDAMVRPTSTGSEPTPAPGNKTGPATTGPYRRYSVLFAIDPNDVVCAATPDGVHHCDLVSMIYVYDADGVLLNSQSNGIKANIPAARVAALQHGGIRFREEISVPVKGESFLRIGIHDQATDRVGAVELPVSAVSNLPPLPVQTPAPPAANAPK